MDLSSAPAFAVFGAFYAFIGLRMRGLTRGALVYPLDDTYIHMAIAKNVALHGVWGISPDGFSATSSSPLWTALLSLTYWGTGVHDVTPLLLNTVLAVLCIFSLGAVLQREGLAGAPLCAALSICVLLAPLAPMAWIGMEHTLHILLTVLTVGATATLIERPSPRRVGVLCLLAAGMVSARYEGLFVVAGCALALMRVRLVGSAVAAITAAVVPVIAVGLWNVSHGWFLLPASILLKQTVLQPAGSLLPSALTTNLSEAPAAFVALLVAATLLSFYRAATRGAQAVHPFLLIFLASGLLHVGFAKFGHLYRYESYLMVLGTVALSVALLGRDGMAPSPPRASGNRSTSELVLVGAVLVSVTFAGRTLASAAVTANMTGHIFRQQRQVAELLRQSYDGEAVALNDIGNTSYHTRVHSTDMVGLGTLEVARLRREGLWDRKHMLDLLDRQGVGIAIVYDAWFPPGSDFFRNWIRVADWTTDEEETRAEGTVSFFARDADAAARLRAALQAFDVAHPDPATTRTIF